MIVMKQFEVGDKVEIVDGNTGERTPCIGSIGTVIGIDSRFPCGWLVEVNTASSMNKWYFYHHELKLDSFFKDKDYETI